MCIFGNDNCLVVLVDRSVRLAGELLPGLRDLIHLARVPLIEDGTNYISNDTSSFELLLSRTLFSAIRCRCGEDISLEL